MHIVFVYFRIGVLLINCNLTVCIFERRPDIKNLTINSCSVPLKTPKTKLEGIPPKHVEGDIFQVKTTPLQQIFSKGLTKILLGRPIDPILNFLQRANRELSQNIYFLPPLACSFLAMAVGFETFCNTSKSPVTPPPPQIDAEISKLEF